MSARVPMKVAVVGAGICGLSAARTLAQRGHSVVLHEQFELFHDRGSSHGASRIVRRAYPDAFYTACMAEAYPLWHDLEADAGVKLLNECGLLYIGPRDAPNLRSMAAGLSELDVPFEIRDRKVGGTTVKSYGYDTAGRTTSVVTGAGTTTLSYDYEDRVTGITYPSSATNSFSYNGLDARVGKVDSTGTYTYKRDGAGVTSAVLSDGTIAYTPGISERKSGTSTFDHADYFGTFSRQTNSSQTTTATRAYDAFGNLQSTTGTPQSPFGFVGAQGYKEDSDSGLKLLGHRYYDPSVGRFLSRDHAKTSRNWFDYCANNPTRFADPTGLYTICGFEFTFETVGDGLQTGLNGALNGLHNGSGGDGSEDGSNGDGYGVSTTLGKIAGVALLAATAGFAGGLIGGTLEGTTIAAGGAAAAGGGGTIVIGMGACSIGSSPTLVSARRRTTDRQPRP